MRFHRLLPSLSLTAVMLVAACSDAPTASLVRGGASTVAASTSASDELANQARKARHDSLMALRDSLRRAAKEQKDQLKTEFAIQQAAWKSFKRDWKTQLKLNKFAQLDLLRCQPLEYSSDAEVIGPKGGTLHIGPHTLEVPAGALSEEQLIVGTSPMGDLVQVDFGPHGLTFLRSAELTLSYEHCLAPTSILFRVVYVDDALRILEQPPSSDRKAFQQVVGRIDHFSSYMIAY